jgi:four helix bundle protein
MAALSVKQTKVYQKVFALAMAIYEISKPFPAEEKYSLTDQIRRSSCSVCTNLAEAYRKKKYPAHFISKLTDSGMENSETGVWLGFALTCKHIAVEKHNELLMANEEIGRMLGHAIENPDKY